MGKGEGLVNPVPFQSHHNITVSIVHNYRYVFEKKNPAKCNKLEGCTVSLPFSTRRKWKGVASEVNNTTMAISQTHEILISPSTLSMYSLSAVVVSAFGVIEMQ